MKTEVVVTSFVEKRKLQAIAGVEGADVLARVLGDGEAVEEDCGDKRLANFLPATLKVSRFLARSKTTKALN